MIRSNKNKFFSNKNSSQLFIHQIFLNLWSTNRSFFLNFFFKNYICYFIESIVSLKENKIKIYELNLNYKFIYLFFIFIYLLSFIMLYYFFSF